MDAEFVGDILIVLEEWRLPIIIVGTLFVAWVLWYTSDGTSTQAANSKIGESKEEEEEEKLEDREVEWVVEEREVVIAREEAANARRVAVEDTLRKPLSLAEEMVAIHNLRS